MLLAISCQSNSVCKRLGADWLPHSVVIGVFKDIEWNELKRRACIDEAGPVVANLVGALFVCEIKIKIARVAEHDIEPGVRQAVCCVFAAPTPHVVPHVDSRSWQSLCVFGFLFGWVLAPFEQRTVFPAGGLDGVLPQDFACAMQKVQLELPAAWNPRLGSK